MNQILAQSRNYRISHIYEQARLEGTDIDGHIVIGEFYGDVECACIDRNEKWCITGGDGVILYQLKAPFEEYQFGIDSEQWTEKWRNEPVKWPEVIYQTDAFKVRLVLDTTSEQRGVYDLDLNTFKLEQLI